MTSDENIYFNRRFNEWEKIFPTQEPNCHLFQGPRTSYEPAVFRYLSSQLGLETLIEDLFLEAPEEWTVEEMGSGRLHLSFVQFLARLVNAQSALEIGTFVGLSAIALAQTIPSSGRIVSIEKFEKFANIARRNIARNNLSNKIEVIVGDALKIFSDGSLGESFDLIFVDGDKANYLEYVRKGLELLSPQGIIIVDDIFFQGDVFNDEPSSHKGAGVKACLEWVSCQTHLDITIVPIGNGVLLVRKRGFEHRPK
jgi:caffeoyl-CoA O-methyltransferase